MFPDHHHHTRPWRKPLSYFLNRLFNFDPYRDFGILDEVVGILLVAVTIAFSVYTSHGATKPYKVTDTIFDEGNNTDLVIRNDGSLALESGSGWVKATNLVDTMRGIALVGNTGAAVGNIGAIGGWNGSTFYTQVFTVEQEQPTTDHLYAVAVAPTREIWAVGDGGAVVRREIGGVWDSWTLATDDDDEVTNNLRGISFLSNEKWIVGSEGTIIRCSGEDQCTSLGGDTVTQWNAIDCADNVCWAVGNGGKIARCSSDGCTLEIVPEGTNLLGVDATTTGVVFIAGEQGTILKGPEWEVLRQGTETLRGVAVSGNRGFAVGDAGAMLSYNGTTWTKTPAPTQKNLNAVVITPAGAWATGAQGTLLRYGNEALFADTGVFESRVIGFDHPINTTAITWDATIPSGATLRFQIATSTSGSTDATNWNYEEPRGGSTDDTNFVPHFYETSGDVLHSSHNEKTFLRYRAYFAKSTNEQTPILRSVAFTTNVEALDTPQLLEPKKAAVLREQPTFSWKSVEGATQYALRVARDKACTNTITTLTKTGTSGIVERPLNDGTYYWCVKASSETVAGDWSPAFSFTVNATPPAAPTLESPTREAKLKASPKTFNWSDVATAKTYTFILAANEAFDAPLAAQSSLTQSAYTFKQTLEPGVYSWRVRAIDAYRFEGPWAEGSFTIEEKDTPPTPKRPSNPQSTAPVEIREGVIHLEGTADAGDLVMISVYTTLVYQTTVATDENGRWSVDIPKQMIPPGDHRITAIARRGDLTSDESPVGAFTIQPPPPPP
ncbi:hypothetical protein HY624_03720, partial [Candidatus Uhrbacteria bacterium]|nr:hypothetical protein [Candidatus Uhrbacteria bacterium]